MGRIFGFTTVALAVLAILAAAAVASPKSSGCKTRRCSASPTVTITAPSANSQVSGTVTVTGTAADATGIASVTVAVDSQPGKPATGTTSWSLPVDTTALAGGTHTITALATDTSGNVVASGVQVSVSNTTSSTPTGSAPGGTSSGGTTTGGGTTSGGTTSGGSTSTGGTVTDPLANVPCTIYVSPTGSQQNSGASVSSTWPLTYAAGRTSPGDVVCLEAGSYTLSSPLYLSRSGAAGSPVVFRSDGGAAVLRSTQLVPDDMIQVQAGTSYVSFDGLSFDGSGVANNAVHCKQGSNHVVFAFNRVQNTASAGFSGSGCDYVQVIHNMFFHIGYNPATSWGSAVTLNSSQWTDTAAGFHSFVIGNIISGTTDASVYDTDGNGIIMDMGGNVPPVLIANNVVYENGGRCIHSFHTQNIWVVNNTCYDNGLDSGLSGIGEIVGGGSDATGNHFINNVVQASPGRYQYQLFNGATASLQSDDGHGGLVGVAPTYTADAGFVAPPSVDWSAASPQSSALAPWNLGNDLQLQATSPLINAGIDPRTAAGITDALVAGMNEFLTTDINGVARPSSGSVDLGAYQH